MGWNEMPSLKVFEDKNDYLQDAQPALFNHLVIVV
jgi:hypothetical protein